MAQEANVDEIDLMDPLWADVAEEEDLVLLFALGE